MGTISCKQLKRNGWKRIRPYFYSKDGFHLRKWATWTLEIYTKTIYDTPIFVKCDIKTLKEVNSLMRKLITP